MKCQREITTNIIKSSREYLIESPCSVLRWLGWGWENGVRVESEGRDKETNRVERGEN